MTTLVPFSLKCSNFKPNIFQDGIYKRSTCSISRLETKFVSFSRNSLELRAGSGSLCFLGGRVFKIGILLEEKVCKREKRVLLVKNNQGFGFNSGDGGGGRDDGAPARLLGNIALAIGLTYLSVTGQLGWILDAIVSIWLIAVLIPIVGLGAFLWWAGRDIIQGTCPNCGNDFQVFKSSVNEDLQLCPFCGQPFSVAGNEFVKDSVKFSNQSTTFGQAFKNFTDSRNEKDSVRAIDIEAEIKDVD